VIAKVGTDFLNQGINPELSAGILTAELSKGK
jgi:hypothetical protein